MKRFSLYISLVLILLVVVISCQEERITAQNVLETMNTLEEKTDWLAYRLNLEEWRFDVSGKADSLTFYRDLKAYLYDDQAAVKTLNLGRNLVRDNTDQQRLKILRYKFLRNAGEATPEIRALKDSIMTLKGRYTPEYYGEHRSLSTLKRIYRFDDDRNNREMAYRAVYGSGERLAPYVERLFRQRQQMALKFGYSNYFNMLFADVEMDPGDYLKLLKKLDSLTAQPYEDLLSQIRAAQGVSETEIWDLYAHDRSVFQKMDYYFPVDSQKVYIRSALADLNIDLDAFPIYLSYPENAESADRTRIFFITPPYDQRLVVSDASGFWSLQDYFGKIGLAIYGTSIAQEQPIFNAPLDGVWEEGMKAVFEDFNTDPEWFEKYTSVPGNVRRDFEGALHTRELIKLRESLVWLNFEYEVYRNPNRDINRLFWDTFEKYMLLPRHDDLMIWATRSDLIQRPVYVQNYLLGKLISAQTLAYLAKHNNQVIGNPDTKAFLVQNYFRFGSRYPWPELLQRGTGEKLNPDYYLESLKLSS